MNVNLVHILMIYYIGLKNVYEKFYINNTKTDLINNFINTFSTYNKKILFSNNEILFQWKQVNKSLAPIKFFIISYILFKNTAYPKICNYLNKKSIYW